MTRDKIWTSVLMAVVGRRKVEMTINDKTIQTKLLDYSDNAGVLLESGELIALEEIADIKIIPY